MPDLLRDGLIVRMTMEHRDEAGVSVYTSQAWRRMFDIRGSLVHELILEFFSTFRFGQAILDLDTPGVLQFQLGGARRRMCWREFILALGLHTEVEMQTARFGAPEKVTVTDLFYLRGIDVGSVNVPYLLVRYLRLFVAGRKSEAHISGGQFVARLAGYFGILTTEILGGLTVITLELQAWVAMGPERQPDAVAGAPAKVEDAPIVDEGSQADPTPAQAPQQPPPQPPASARTMVQRLGRLEEDIQGLRRDVGRL
ncbi:hypothetical protein Tco_1365782 [Tanacetum coccineum]